MIVVDVEWADTPVLAQGMRLYNLRLIYDSDIEELGDEELLKQVQQDTVKFVGHNYLVYVYKVTKHTVSSDCIAFHGVPTDSDLSFLRFGYFKDEDVEESVIPKGYYNVPVPDNVKVLVKTTTVKDV
jgi:hypothetical protein